MAVWLLCTLMMLACSVGTTRHGILPVLNQFLITGMLVRSALPGGHVVSAADCPAGFQVRSPDVFNTSNAPTNVTGNEKIDRVALRTMNRLMNKAWTVAQWKVLNVVMRLPTGRYPVITVETGQWKLEGYFYWTSGFWPGILWYLYNETSRTGSPSAYGWKAYAETWTLGMVQTKEEWLKGKQYHDMGFMYFNSFWPKYTADKDDLSLSQLQEAAKELARRYNGNVKAFLSWTVPRAPGFGVIVDSMMNILMLPVLAKMPGGNGTWTALAIRHAETILKNHVREDNTTFHYVSFDPVTGKRLRRITVAGYNDNSVWSRGQAWAMYGFAGMYQLTNRPEFLTAALRLSSWFWDHLPDDLLPYWDFRDPAVKTDPNGVTRDSSAGAVAACAMLMLAEEVPQQSARVMWAERASKMIQALTKRCLPLMNAKFKGGTPVMLKNPVKRNVTSPVSILSADILRPVSENPRGGGGGTSYGDYYFLEAMTRCRKNNVCLNTPLA